MLLEIEKETVIIESKKNEESFGKFKNKVLKISKGISIGLIIFYIVMGSISFILEGDFFSDIGMLYIIGPILSVGLVSLMAYLIYWLTKMEYDNVHWTITNKGLTQTSYKVKTFIPISHISSVIHTKETLKVITIDKNQPLCISFLKNANEFKKSLDDLIYKTVKQKEVVVLENDNSMNEIKKYKDLLDSGIITQEDFDTKKKQLLDL